MNTERVSQVSVLEPVGQAVEKTKAILFKPFDLNKWFVIGFCAWLAGIAGGGFNFRLPGSCNRGGGGWNNEAAVVVKDFVMINLVWIIPVAVIGVMFLIAMGILFAWLSSRGKFMFLHCVAENKAEIKTPWRQFERPANNLFIFRIIAGLICFAVFAVIGGLMVLGLWAGTSFIRPAAGIIAGVGMISFVSVILVVAIVLSIFYKFTYDFVVPIMYLRRCKCLESWKEFLGLLSVNKKAFVLYILFQIVLSLAIGMIALVLFAVGFCCCCCGAVILCLPYISTVVLLPLLVFKRTYSLYYFQQFGYDVFACGSAAIE